MIYWSYTIHYCPYRYRYWPFCFVLTCKSNTSYGIWQIFLFLNFKLWVFCCLCYKHQSIRTFPFHSWLKYKLLNCFKIKKTWWFSGLLVAFITCKAAGLLEQDWIHRTFSDCRNLPKNLSINNGVPQGCVLHTLMFTPACNRACNDTTATDFIMSNNAGF